VVNIPATPLHYPLAYTLYRVSSRRLDLPALVIGAMTPDLEIILFELAGRPGGVNRLVLHSLFGALLICPVLVVLLRWAIYAPLARTILQTEIGHRGTGLLLLSGAVGALSHVLLDVPGHPYNPLLWPLTAESVNLFQSWMIIDQAQAATHAVMVLATAAILVTLAKGAHGWRDYLRRLFCNQGTSPEEAVSQG